MINDLIKKIKKFKKEEITNKRVVIILFVLLFCVISYLDSYKREADKDIKIDKSEKEACMGLINEKDYLECKMKKNAKLGKGSYTYFYFKEGELVKYSGESQKGLARVSVNVDAEDVSCATNQPTVFNGEYLLLEANNVNAACVYDKGTKAIVIFQDKDKGYKRVFKELLGKEIDEKGNVD